MYDLFAARAYEQNPGMAAAIRLADAMEIAMLPNLNPDYTPEGLPVRPRQECRDCGRDDRNLNSDGRCESCEFRADCRDAGLWCEWNNHDVDSTSYMAPDGTHCLMCEIQSKSIQGDRHEQ